MHIGRKSGGDEVEWKVERGLIPIYLEKDTGVSCLAEHQQSSIPGAGRFFILTKGLRCNIIL